MSNYEPGYAVVDTETTGLRPGWHDRVVEVAAVHVSPDGEITGQWDTLVNPERDLGPQHIHHITAAEILHAPTFGGIADDLAAVLAGRVVVAHNLRFDISFLRAEYQRCGLPVPIDQVAGLCTMNLARRYLPGAGRSLADCCAAFGIEISGAHRASADAHADAELLAGYLTLDRDNPQWTEALSRAAALPWPTIPLDGRGWYPREQARTTQQHFLARLVEHLASDPADPEEHTVYLAMLDRALLDRHISVTEAETLVAIAAELRIGPSTARRLHHEYLRQLTRLAWDDGVITDDERADLYAVGALLDIDTTDVDATLAATRKPAVPDAPQESFTPFWLEPGDRVVFTGEMRHPREEWEHAAASAGLIPHPAVTKKVKLLVAADPDSLSGKARKARDYRIPVVTEDTFARMLDGMFP
ncbi:MAG: exonuclease domain-containing protein [Sciscionella sp.]